MTTQIRPTKKTTKPPSSNGHVAEAETPAPPIANHPLASVLGSFANDPAALDAIMAGVEKYRRQLEAEPDPAE